MGIYNTLITYRRCKYCRNVHKYDVQFKSENITLTPLQIGDKTNIPAGVYVGLYLEACDNAAGIQEAPVIVHPGGIISISGDFYSIERFHGEKYGYITQKEAQASNGRGEQASIGSSQKEDGRV